MPTSSPSVHSTQATIDAALSAAREKKIDTLIVASGTGASARLLLGSKGFQVVVVTHVFGFPEPGRTEFDPEIRVELLSAGFSVLTTAHALSGGERALSSKFGGAYPLEIVANTLRFFGQGTKVAVEIATMALDAGLIPHGRPVIALGGTNSGLDTALEIVPAGSARLFETRILDVVTRPTTA